MRVRDGIVLPVLLSALLWCAGLRAADYKVEDLKEAAKGISADVAKAVNEAGYRISGKDGVICDIWLAKEIPLKPNFKSSLRIKYPFLPGQFVGVIRFPEKSQPTDFRGQPLEPGVYTLRYGLQPDDGNHLGTSEIRDFLVGCPPKMDADPKRVEDIKDLFKLSAGAAGTTHPAIFLLLPPAEKALDKASVKHDEEKQQVILNVNASGKGAEKAAPVPVSVVVVGKSEG